MNIELKTDESIIGGGPVYGEPYKGFFKENGFSESDFLGLCNHQELHNKTTKVKLAGMDSQNEGYLLHVSPLISTQRTIYLNGDVELVFYDNDGNMKSRHTPAGVSRSVRCIGMGVIKQMEKQGLDASAKIKMILNDMENVGGEAWCGYETGIITSGSLQSVILREDFSSTKQRIDIFNEYLENTAKTVYSWLSEEKIVKLSKFLDSRSEKMSSRFVKLYFGITKDMDADPYMDEEAAGLLPKEERERLEAEAERKTQRKLEEPIQEWASVIQEKMNGTGITACEEEFRVKVRGYCSANGLELREETIPKQDFMVRRVMSIFESNMR